MYRVDLGGAAGHPCFVRSERAVPPGIQGARAARFGIALARHIREVPKRATQFREIRPERDAARGRTSSGGGLRCLDRGVDPRR